LSLFSVLIAIVIICYVVCDWPGRLFTSTMFTIVWMWFIVLQSSTVTVLWLGTCKLPLNFSQVSIAFTFRAFTFRAFIFCAVLLQLQWKYLNILSQFFYHVVAQSL